MELLLMVGAAIAMSRVAEEDEKSGFLWGGITFALCLASLLIPIPYLRVLIATIVSFGLMASRN